MKIIIYVPSSPKEATHLVAKEPAIFFMSGCTHVKEVELNSEEELNFYKSLLKK